MKLRNHLNDPVYVRRPSQIIRRIRHEFSTPSCHTEALLPWGGKIRVISSETIGRTILHRGVHDLQVVEACFRLADAGATVVDVGANIGQMTSALAHAVGQTGRIYAFEPHHALFDLLTENVLQMKSELPGVSVSARQEALSDQTGEAKLYSPAAWKSNAGLASMEKRSADQIELSVRMMQMDDLDLVDGTQVLKLDVEGHELAVLRGAGKLLKKRSIKNIIFEDFDIVKSEVARLLRGFGYTIFAIQGTVKGPRLADLLSIESDLYNYIATTDPEDCWLRYASAGWRCLKRRT